MLTQKLFGTDGIRGKAGQFPLDPPTIKLIGYFLARRLGSGSTIVIGRDTRESGPWIEEAISRGIALGGGRTIAAGVIPTPGVALLTKELQASAGLVISASHNPYHDNGLKIFSPSGQKLSDEMEMAISEDVTGIGPALLPALERAVDPPAEVNPALAQRYQDFLRARISAPLVPISLKIALDCANGAASQIAPQLFASLGAEVTVINAAPDGQNINQDCGALHPDRLQELVIASGADLGFAFDGDADRLMLVDGQGRLLDGDHILYLMTDYLSRHQQLTGNRVVATVMSNLGLEIALRKRGIDLVRTAVGDKYVLDELLRGGGAIGGEQSGHIILPEISLAGDGMLSALEILRVVIESGRPVADLAAGMERMPQVLINLPVSHKVPFEEMPAVTAELSRLENEMAGNGRILLRYSGTENLVRIMIEGSDETTIRGQAESLARLIDSQLNS
ncbi:MAG: phosphoglucosamine mutase [Acidobacteriota bacterium]